MWRDCELRPGLPDWPVRPVPCPILEDWSAMEWGEARGPRRAQAEGRGASEAWGGVRPHPAAEAPGGDRDDPGQGLGIPELG